MNENILGDHIRLCRKRSGLSQENLGKLLYVTQNTIGSYERGTISPSVPMLLTIAQFFGVSTDWLLGYEPKNKYTPKT